MSLGQRIDEVRGGFERSFWVANVSEIFERLAYYGSFASLANYLRETLSFPTQQTGTLTGIFGGMVWFLAIFGGAVADKLGFRRALSLAYLILTAAYFLLGSIGAPWLAPVRNAVPLELFVGCILILPALGISLVKPSDIPSAGNMCVPRTGPAAPRCVPEPATALQLTPAENTRPSKSGTPAKAPHQIPTCRPLLRRKSPGTSPPKIPPIVPVCCVGKLSVSRR